MSSGLAAVCSIVSKEDQVVETTAVKILAEEGGLEATVRADDQHLTMSIATYPVHVVLARQSSVEEHHESLEGVQEYAERIVAGLQDVAGRMKKEGRWSVAGPRRLLRSWTRR